VASSIGISDVLVGLTVVAAGTSLPELATSIVAAVRRESDIAIGNVLGSNVFNVMGILGLTGLVRPLTIAPHIRHLDLPVALAFAVASVPIMLSARRISRLEGLTLCLGYAAYVALLTLKALAAT
jgi:cation:H+ antiporter